MVDYDSIADDMQADTGRPYKAPAAASSDQPDNKYDSIADEMTSDQKAQLQQSAFAASQRDPDKYAKTIRTANQIGVAPTVVEGNEKEAQEKADQTSVNYDKLITSSPKTAEFLQDPDNASVAKDSVVNTAQHEQMVQDHGFLNTLIDSLQAGWQNSATGMLTRGKEGDLAPNANLPWYDRAAAQAAGLTGDLPFMILGGVLGGVGGATLGAGTGVAAGTMALSGIGTLSGGAALAAIGAAGGAGAGAFALPAAIKTALREHFEKGDVQDLPDLISRTKDILAESTKQALVGLATEATGGLTSTVLGKFALPAAVKTALTTTAEVGAMTKAGAAVEGKDAQWQDYLDGAILVGGMHAATGISSNMVGQWLESKKAEANKDFVQNVEQVASDSNLKARSPEKYNEMLGELTNGTQTQNVYVPVDAATTYFQGKGIDPKEAMESLGASKSFEEAKQTGGDVQIPFKNFVTSLSGTEHISGLSDDLKFSPDQMTVNEAKQEAAGVMAKMSSVDKEASEAAASGQNEGETAGEVKSSDPGKQIADSVSQQLQEAGYDKKTADTYSEIYGSTFRTLGERTGQDPMELFQQYGLKINRADEAPAEGANTFNQGSIKSDVDAFFQAPDAEEKYNALPDSDKGRIINGDTARDLYPPYTADREGAVLHTSDTDAPAGKFTNELFKKKAAELKEGDIVHALSGGAAAGKSSYLKRFAKTIDTDLIYDSTSSHYAKTKELIDEALKSNKHFQMTFIYKPFEEALQGNKDRFASTGRLVDPHYMAYSHVQSLETFLKLRDDFKDNPRVTFEAFNNTGNKSAGMSLEELEALRYSNEKTSPNAAVKRLKKVAEKSLENEVAEVEKTKSEAAGSSSGQPAEELGRGPQSKPTHQGFADQGAPGDDSESQNVGEQSDKINGQIAQLDEKIKSAQDLVDRGGLNVTGDSEKEGAANFDYYKKDENGKSKADLDKFYVEQAKQRIERLQKEKDDLLNGKVTKLFQSGDEAPRGQISIGADRNVKIDLLKNADLSTFLHETGHFYMEVLGNIAESESAPKQIKDDYATVLNWLGADSRADITPEMHEKWARGFESYLMKGEAPSSSLRQVFNRLKVWLLSVYRHSKLLNVELTPEVAGVMSRLMATDYEIKSAESSQHQEPLFGRVGAYKMNDADAARYYEAFQDAREHAETTLNKKLMADYQREKEAWYKERRAEIKKEVEKHVEDQRVYRAIDALQTGKIDPVAGESPMSGVDRFTEGEKAKPLDLRLSKQAIIDQFGKETFEKLQSIEGKKVYTNRDGIHPEVAAPLLGYSSGIEMLREMTESPKKSDAIDHLTDSEMDRRYPDHMDPATMPQDAIDAIHNDKRAQVLRMELEHLQNNNPAVMRGMIKRAAARVPSDEVVRAQAVKIIADKNISEVSPYQYELAERKAAKQAGEALARGDIDATFEAKQRELLNHELYREAAKAREDVEKQLGKFKKISRSDEDVSKSRDTDLINAARAILSNFGIGKTDRTAESYLSKIKAYDPDTYNNIMGLVEAATEKTGNYKDMSYDDFTAMSDAVNAIYDLSKSRHEIEIEGKRIDAEQVKEELKAKIAQSASPETKPGVEKAVTTIEKAGMKLLSAGASLTRVEHWINAVDVDRNGPFRRYVWNPVIEGITKYKLEKERVMNEYGQILKEIKGSITREKISAPELNYTFKDKTELLMALLHSGNESNLDKLLRGREWGKYGEDGVLDRSRWDSFVSRMQKEGTLAKPDYDFAQKVWDLMEKMKPDAQKAHKEMYGYYFNEVTADQIKTPFGEYKGGYIPAKVDLWTNEDQAIRQEREDFEKNNNSWQFPTTGRGFSKSRVQEYAAPLSLEFSLLRSHIDSALRFTNIEPRVKDVARIITDKGLRSDLSQLNSSAGKDLLMPWLQRAAQQRLATVSDSGIGKLMDTGARYLRKNTAMQIMMGNVTNALHQLTGFFVAGTRVDPNYLIRSLGNYMTGPKDFSTNVLEKSDFMKTLKSDSLNDTDTAIKGILHDPNTFEKLQDFSAKHMYFLQKITHGFVSPIVWSGAYDQAIARGEEEATAIKEADSAVSMTQHMSGPEHVSQYESGTETRRLFTMFTGYFNQLANLNAGEMLRTTRELGLKKGAGKLFYTYMMGVALPSIAYDLIKKTMAGKFNNINDGDDDDHLHDMMDILFGSQVRTMTAMIPFVGPIINSTLNNFGDNYRNDSLQFSPVVSTIEGAVKTPAEVYKQITGEMDNKKKVMRDVLELVGTASGLPLGPLGRPLGYMMSVDDGTATPKGPVDFARGMVTGQVGAH